MILDDKVRVKLVRTDQQDEDPAVFIFRKGKPQDKVEVDQLFDGLSAEEEEKKIDLVLKFVMKRIESIENCFYPDKTPLTIEQLKNLDTFTDLLWSVFNEYKRTIAEDDVYTGKKTLTPTVSANGLSGV